MIDLTRPTMPPRSRALLPVAALLLGLAPLHAGPFSGIGTATPEKKPAPPAGSLGPSLASTWEQKARLMPRFYQRDPRAGFPNGGRDYCCPVSAAVALIALDQSTCHGLSPGGTDFDSQVQLVNLLASTDYFGTDPEEGTPPGGMLRGLRRYVEKQGFHCHRLEYEGWRTVGRAEQAAVKATLPDLAWLQSGAHHPRGAVWLNVGWYVPAGEKGQWQRTGGHWVNLAGCLDPAAAANSNAATLVIRNSLKNDQSAPNTSHAAGGEFDADLLCLQRQNDGEVLSKSGSRRLLRGSYLAHGPGLPTKSGTTAFLDGAILLVVGQ
jgi:hypothetical protein